MNRAVWVLAGLLMLLGVLAIATRDRTPGQVRWAAIVAEAMEP